MVNGARSNFERNTLIKNNYKENWISIIIIIITIIIIKHVAVQFMYYKYVESIDKIVM